MIVGILQVELTIDAAESIKDKRRVVRSVKDRLHHHYMVSVAEVGAQDVHRTAMLGIVMASTDVGRCHSTLDRIIEELRRQRDCYVSDFDKQVLTGLEPSAEPGEYE